MVPLKRYKNSPKALFQLPLNSKYFQLSPATGQTLNCVCIYRYAHFGTDIR